MAHGVDRAREILQAMADADVSKALEEARAVRSMI